MELSAVGESVFAAESITKRRIRRVKRYSPAYALRPLRSHGLLFPLCCASSCLCSSNVSGSRVHLNNQSTDPFAGSLGISGEMEGLVSKVSTGQATGYRQRSCLVDPTTAASRTVAYSFLRIVVNPLRCLTLPSV